MSTFKQLSKEELPDSDLWKLYSSHSPDLSLIDDKGGNYCSLWWNDVPEAGLGVIGHYEAKNESISKQLLEEACQILREQGCKAAVGPMNGNTWRSYRFVSWQGEEQPYLLEPQNPMEWPDYWLSSQFKPWHEYISSMVVNHQNSSDKVKNYVETLKQKGIHWRNINKSYFKNELKQVFQLSLNAFKDNVLYTPLSEDSFLSQYLPFADKVDERFVLLAEDDKHHLCGFVFAIPDYAQLQRGEALNRLIIKTLAIHDHYRGLGLGSVLVDEIQKRAFEAGLSHSIHALMYSENISTSIGKNSELIRRYTLYRRELG